MAFSDEIAIPIGNFNDEVFFPVGNALAGETGIRLEIGRKVEHIELVFSGLGAGIHAFFYVDVAGGARYHAAASMIDTDTVVKGDV